MTEKKEKANYILPNSQVDLEERLAKGNASDRVISTSDDHKPADDDGNGREFALEDNNLDGYVGVDPIYQTYANETDAPLRADGGPEAELEAFIYGDDEDDEALVPKTKEPDVQSPVSKSSSGASSSSSS